MGFELGRAKTGGRKAGTRNKKSEVFSEALNHLGLDVVKALTELLPSLHPEKRADVLLAFLPYLFPRLKPVEVAKSENILESFADLLND